MNDSQPEISFASRSECLLVKIIHVTIRCCSILSICIISASFTGRKALFWNKRNTETFIVVESSPSPSFSRSLPTELFFCYFISFFSSVMVCCRNEKTRKETLWKLTVNKLCISEGRQETIRFCSDLSDRKISEQLFFLWLKNSFLPLYFCTINLASAIPVNFKREICALSRRRKAEMKGKKRIYKVLMTRRYSGKWTSYDALRATNENPKREMEDRRRTVRLVEALSHINFRSPTAMSKSRRIKRSETFCVWNWKSKTSLLGAHHWHHPRKLFVSRKTKMKHRV